MKPPAELFDRVERLLGARPVEAKYRSGGFSIAGRWTLDLADGRKVFAKLATTGDIARRLREEHRNISAIDADFVCEVLSWEDGERPLLLLEDLSHGRWPPPWEGGDVERVLDVLHRVAVNAASSRVPGAEMYRDVLSGWQRVVHDPAGFLSLGLATAEWFERCASSLIEAERAAVLEGDDLVHFDVRSDNLCFVDGRVVLVDWNWACRGPAGLDVALWLPSLRLEGGPLPDEVMPGAGAYASAFSGYLADNAHRPVLEGAPTVRRFQLRQLRISLPWACRELGLPEPNLPWAMTEIEAAKAGLDAGRISEDEWYARLEEPLTDAYLSYAEPWRQSGKGGDEVEWRWGRELVLDVARDGDAILDVGCANGHLMESFHRWGAERGLRVEPYGVDISWRLVSLARRRLPRWADRIFEANVMRWTPPRRFEVVHTALDYMPPARRREHVERVLHGFLTPGGRLVLRAARMPGPDPAAALEELGFRPDGIVEAVHPKTGETRRTAWVSTPVA